MTTYRVYNALRLQIRLGEFASSRKDHHVTPSQRVTGNKLLVEHAFRQCLSHQLGVANNINRNTQRPGKLKGV
ncbi:MAG: hypothetical protein QGH33_10845 [Pirellulaceae bacterium]|nr:hypothetical protein [Pirellulaceae bacterium]